MLSVRMSAMMKRSEKAVSMPITEMKAVPNPAYRLLRSALREIVIVLCLLFA